MSNGAISFSLLKNNKTFAVTLLLAHDRSLTMMPLRKFDQDFIIKEERRVSNSHNTLYKRTA